MLYIIRHGQTDWNLTNKIQGAWDIPLNDTGRNDARGSAEKLRGLGLEKIISSDLSRAKETAEIIGNVLNIKVSYDARLREVDFGKFNGTSAYNMTPETVAGFVANPAEFDAEPFDKVFTRVSDFLGTMDYDANMLVVSHGALMRFMMHYFANNAQFNLKKFMQNYFNAHIGNMTVFRIRNVSAQMERLG